MEIIESKLHPKVLKNQLFIRAVDFVIEKYDLKEGQKAVSQMTHIGEPTLSNIRNDRKIVSDKTIRKFMDAFPGIFNPEYFYGRNICMTMEELMQEKAGENNPMPESYTHSTLEESILIEKAVQKATAYADKAIAALEQQIADKQRLIDMMQRRIADLERENGQLRQYDQLRDYPFEMGTAESGVYKNKDERPRV